MLRSGLLPFACCVLVLGAPQPALAPNIARALASIDANDLKANLSFLASDALQGRYTPSPGLDIAAEFIASRFRAIGLEPGGNDGYFQTAQMVERREKPPLGDMAVCKDGKTITIHAHDYVVSNSSRAETIKSAAIVAFAKPDIDGLRRTNVKGKAVLVRRPDFRSMTPDEGNAAYEAMSEFNSELQRSGAAVELQAVDRQPEAAHGMLIASDSLPERAVPVLTVDGRNANLFPGSGATFSVDIPAPDETRVVVKNVIGILRGSDPVLSKTAVLVTAHYDHIGTAETADGSAMTKATAQDRIYNGANDDGSGTVSVIEIAKAVTKLRPAPKRSLVFMTFFGEERGLLGSDYYGRHPVFPIAKTVADINLEQLGRTDELIDGKLVPQINSLSLTGFRYSTLTTFFEAAGRMLGVRVYEDKQASNRYFLQSDNAALARQGVPAHSLTVAFEFPDYHGVGDEWQKIDFSNMARIDKLIALAALRIADSRVPPSWNAQEAATQSYRDAQRRSQGESKF